MHANGDVVCSIIDGRGDFILGNVHDTSIQSIVSGPRAAALRELVASTADEYCQAIGKRCPLKTLPSDGEGVPPATLRFLAIEPTTACSLRCLACPVRDLAGEVRWWHALRDGGPSFLIWDALRRAKQHLADDLAPVFPRSPRGRQTRMGALLRRGRLRPSRTGMLPLDVVRRIVTEAGPGIERIDLFNYGEPFLYPHLLDTLRHVRRVAPSTTIATSTSGMHLTLAMEQALVEEQLLDWLVFSVDGCDEATYGRYRVGGRFDVAFGNLVRCARRAAGTKLHVVWQYVVFAWNDSDNHLQRAIQLAGDVGVPLQFDFARTWGRSRRRPGELRYLTPYLRPFTALPGEPRRDGR